MQSPHGCLHRCMRKLNTKTHSWHVLLMCKTLEEVGNQMQCHKLSLGTLGTKSCHALVFQFLPWHESPSLTWITFLAVHYIPIHAHRVQCIMGSVEAGLIFACSVYTALECGHFWALVQSMSKSKSALQNVKGCIGAEMQFTELLYSILSG